MKMKKEHKEKLEARSLKTEAGTTKINCNSDSEIFGDRFIAFEVISSRCLSSFGLKSRGLQLAAHRSWLIVQYYLKMNSTVNIIVSLLPWQECIYNHSFFALSKAGNETEEQAFRACELLLN